MPPASIPTASAASLRRGARLLLKTLDIHCPTARGLSERSQDTQTTRLGYEAAIRTLDEADIAVSRVGIDEYVCQRQAWQSLACRVALPLGVHDGGDRLPVGYGSGR